MFNVSGAKNAKLEACAAATEEDLLAKVGRFASRIETLGTGATTQSAIVQNVQSENPTLQSRLG